jgi:hypothetical protein
MPRAADTAVAAQCDKLAWPVAALLIAVVSPLGMRRGRVPKE